MEHEEPVAHGRGHRVLQPHVMRLALNAWFWDSPTTGSGQYTRQLVAALADLDPDLQIVLVVPCSGRQERREEAAEGAAPPDRRAWGRETEGECHPWPDQDVSPVLHPVPCSRSNLGKAWFEQAVFPRVCAGVEADVGHVPYWAPPARSRVPLVVTIHDVIPVVLRGRTGCSGGGPLQRLYTALVSATARGATLVLTDSQASRNDILSRLGLPPRRVRVVPLAADNRYGPEPGPDDAAVRAAYGLPDRYVLYLGAFGWRKNLSNVFATYRWAGPVIGEECPLVIAGQLPERDTANTPDPRRLMEEEGVPQGYVHFTGFVDEVDKPACYRGAAAFIFPSRYEGFGLPPLEAMCCGTPVVGSDAASLPEIIGDAGVLLPPDDAQGMAGALIQLAEDEGFRAEMRRRALDQAATFSWERTARATLQAYRDARD